MKIKPIKIKEPKFSLHINISLYNHINEIKFYKA